MKFLISIIAISSILPLVLSHTLKFVSIVHRHGDRSPETACPSNTIWKHGSGHLTDEGREAARKLGKYFRERYDGFLPVEYKPEDIYVLSSDIPRTLMTANLILDGLYKTPVEDRLLCQPIPIRTLPAEMDNLIYFNYFMCPNYLNEFKMEMDNLRYSRYYSKINEFIGFLKEIAQKWPQLKVKDDMVDILMKGHDLHDCFYIEERHGIVLPDWAKKYYPQPLEEMSKLFFSVFDHNSSLQKYHCGPLLKHIKDNLDKVISKKSKTKFYLYSGHDMTIVSLLQCLKKFDLQMELVPYLGAVIFELYETSPNQHEVKVIYRRETKVNFYSETVLINCSYGQFKNLVSGVELEDWNEECNEDSSVVVKIPG